MRNYNKKLIAYSAFTTTYLLMQKDLNAQAIYVDIEPDMVVESHDLPMAYYSYLDLDLDGHIDFDFIGLSYLYTFFDFRTEFRQNVWVGFAYWGDINNNFIAGYVDTQWTYSGYAYLRYASALQKETPINAELQMYGWVAHKLLFRDYSSFVYAGDTIFGTSAYGPWYGIEEDRYLGLKFKAGDGNSHYGWIRCQILDGHEEGFTLIVKDYAYESKPNRGIAAGDTIGDDSPLDLFVATEQINPLQAKIYSYQNTIHIHFNNQLPLNTKVTIYSITGQQLFAQQINDAITTINCSTFAVGLYVVELANGQHQFNQKVMIE